MVVALTGYVGAPLDLYPEVLVERGKEDVALGSRLDLCHIYAAGRGKGGGEDRRAADDAHLARSVVRRLFPGDLRRFGKTVADEGSARFEGAVAGKDDVESAGQRPARQALPGPSAHDHGLAQGELSEESHVGFQPPWKGTAAADDAVGGAGDGPEGENGAQTAIGALIAGWAR